MSETNEPAKKAAKKEKMKFQEALTLVHKDLSTRKVKKKVKDANGKTSEIEVVGVFDHNETVDVTFTEDFHAHSKGDNETLGLLTGLSYVKMGIAKKA